MDIELRAKITTILGRDVQPPLPPLFYEDPFLLILTSFFFTKHFSEILLVVYFCAL